MISFDVFINQILHRKSLMKIEVGDVCWLDQLEAGNYISTHKRLESYSNIVIVSTREKGQTLWRLVCLNSFILETTALTDERVLMVGSAN